MSIERRLLELVRRDCANHMREGGRGQKDYCLEEPLPGHRCVFANQEGARCRYFEEAILPLDPGLQALYEADREAKAHGDELTKARAAKVMAAATIQVKCERCGKPFAPKSNRQKVCTACRTQVARERNRERQRRRREAAD